MGRRMRIEELMNKASRPVEKSRGSRMTRGYQGPKLQARLAEMGLGEALEIIEKPKDIKGFTVLYRAGWVVERTFAWMFRCREPTFVIKDYERSLASSLAWCRLAACGVFWMRRCGAG